MKCIGHSQYDGKVYTNSIFNIKATVTNKTWAGDYKHTVIYYLQLYALSKPACVDLPSDRGQLVQKIKNKTNSSQRE